MSSIRPMLAAKAPAGGLDLPAYASAKIDGIRCVIQGARVVTRKFEFLPNAHVQALLGHPMFEGLDGEIVSGDPYGAGVFNRTQSAVMSRDGKPPFDFYVFDYCLPTANVTPYSRRLELLQEGFADPSFIQCPFVRLLEQEYVTELDHLTALQEGYLERGYEGAILRNPDAGYKFGRSTDNPRGAVHAVTGEPLQPWTMVKLKKFEQGEARITACIELMQNENDRDEDALGLSKRSTAKEGLVPAGVLGSLRVVDCESGVAFGIGSGFTADQRAQLWQWRAQLVGQVVRYKHFEVGVKVAPRFPIFLGFRDERDMGEPR